MKFIYLWDDVWKYYKYTKRKSHFRRLCAYYIRSIQWYILTPFYKFILLTKSHRTKKYKWESSICCIFKDEAPFLKEWIEYHRIIGVDHFYLYNNFSTDNYKEILSPYIEKNIVTLIDWPFSGSDNALDKAYTHCLTEYKDETHWLALIDLDEFIHLKNENSINKWLLKYQNYPSVYLFWKHFGTSGIIKHPDNGLVIENYTSCWHNYCDLGKAIVNNDFYFPKGNGHIIKAKVKFGGLNLSIPCINDKKRFNVHSYPWGLKSATAQINHYYIRGFEDRYYKCFKRGFAWTDNQEDYYEYDRITPYEEFCTDKDYSIQRHLITLKIRLKGSNYPGYNKPE